MADQYVAWKVVYNIGIAKIDEQHQKLAEIINQLHEGLADLFTTKNRTEAFRDTIHECVEYTKYHFGVEERLMAAISYPGYDEQIEEHREFVGKIIEAAKSFQNGDRFSPNRFVAFLRTWLLNHIASVDQELGRFVQNMPRLRAALKPADP